MTEVMVDIREEVSSFVKEYFSDECEVDLEEIDDSTLIIEDLDGDSLMFLSLLEIIKKKYDVDVEIKTIGKRLMTKPADTIGDIVEMILLVIEYGEDIPE